MKSLRIEWDYTNTEFLLEDKENEIVKVSRLPLGGLNEVIDKTMKIIASNYPIHEILIDIHGSGMQIANGILAELHKNNLDDIKVYKLRYIRM